VEGFIEKLAGILRTLLGNGGGSTQSRSTDDAVYGDPDLRNAWKELDDYMRGGTDEGSRRAEEHRARGSETLVDESLRQDYEVLEVPFGADIETVRKSYKALILRYHPDKHAGDAEKQRIALEITKKINESFERIRSRTGLS
jgi:hypothetical protein